MPYLSRRLLSDNNPRMRAALRHLLYGEGKRIDLARLSKMMSAFGNFSTDGELLLGLAGWVGVCVGGRAHWSALKGGPTSHTYCMHARQPSMGSTAGAHVLAVPPALLHHPVALLPHVMCKLWGHHMTYISEGG